MAGFIDSLCRSKRILVCVGPGGVGKTTTAASLGALAARARRRAVVCTIDPAPRLANALGLSTLGPEPHAVPPATTRALGVPEDAPPLQAVRLDTAAAFRGLVESEVSDAAMRARIFGNPIYREITTTLTGSQEYAAMLALDDLVGRADHDVVVLDTPPTANALDFLEAPARLEDALTSPVIRWFARAKASPFSMQRLRSGGAIVVGRLAKMAGSAFVEDIASFVTDFSDVLGGFLARARAVEALLRTDDVGFVLVLTPEAAAVDEALYFHRRLTEAGIPLAGFLANRVGEPGGSSDAADLASRLRRLPAGANLTGATLDLAAERLARTALDLDRLCASERRELARLAAQAPGVPIACVPLVDEDAGAQTALGRVVDVLAA